MNFEISFQNFRLNDLCHSNFRISKKGCTPWPHYCYNSIQFSVTCLTFFILIHERLFCENNMHQSEKLNTEKISYSPRSIYKLQMNACVWVRSCVRAFDWDRVSVVYFYTIIVRMYVNMNNTLSTVDVSIGKCVGHYNGVDITRACCVTATPRWYGSNFSSSCGYMPW